VGVPVPLSGNQSLKDLSGIDASKFFIMHVPGNRYQIYATLQKYALCLYSNGKTKLLGFPNNAAPSDTYDIGADDDICIRDKIYISLTGADNPYPVFRVRSVYSMIQYIGEILRWQDKNEGKCIFAALPQTSPGDCVGDVLFRINGPNENHRVEVVHHGKRFYIGETRDCDSLDLNQTSCDYSLDVLSVIQVLLNLNKTAHDIPQTPTVRNIP
jgi:hypothetical protein